MKNKILFIVGLFMGFFSIWANAQTPTGRTLKIGTVYWAIDDSTGVKSIYEVWNNQCPPNVYVHDTLNHYIYIHDTTKNYIYVHDTVTLTVIKTVHDTTLYCPPAPPLVYTSVITTQTLPTNLGNDHSSLGNGIVIGSKFRSSVAGYIVGVRYYKVAGVTGLHTGQLYTLSGSKLASNDFIETASGWQTVQFTTPILIMPNTTYIASVFSSAGYYTGTGGYLTGKSISNTPLTILADGTDGVNGVFDYSNTPIMPTSSYKGGFYWVDIIFTPK